jgi:acyl-coenzyme A thioesterase PaaI-like protein
MFDKYRKIALTTKVDMDFLRPVGASSELTVIGRVEEENGRRISVNVHILDSAGKVCTKSRVDYFIPKRQMTYRIMGKERFTGKFQQYLED